MYCCYRCSDVRVFYNNDPTSDAKPVYIYSALKTSEVYVVTVLLECTVVGTYILTMYTRA